jgi:hypothetical protein
METPEYKLTKKVQCSKKCKDGKSRNFLLYFLNGNLILKQKFPYDENYDKGFDKRTHIYDEFILNGRLYQTRKGEDRQGLIDNHYWQMIKEAQPRQVRFPLSKKRLQPFEIPVGLKIEIQ